MPRTALPHTTPLRRLLLHLPRLLNTCRRPEVIPLHPLHRLRLHRSCFPQTRRHRLPARRLCGGTGTLDQIARPLHPNRHEAHGGEDAGLAGRIAEMMLRVFGPSGAAPALTQSYGPIAQDLRAVQGCRAQRHSCMGASDRHRIPSGAHLVRSGAPRVRSCGCWVMRHGHLGRCDTSRAVRDTCRKLSDRCRIQPDAQLSAPQARRAPPHARRTVPHHRAAAPRARRTARHPCRAFSDTCRTQANSRMRPIAAQQGPPSNEQIRTWLSVSLIGSCP